MTFVITLSFVAILVGILALYVTESNAKDYC